MRLVRAIIRLTSIRFFRFFRHVNFKTLQQTLLSVGRQRLPGLASEMAYNAMLSIFPAILAILTAIGLFGASTQNTFQGLVMQLSEVAPQEVLVLVDNFVKAQLYNSRNSGLFSLSFVAAIWTASSVLNSAMAALDQIYKIPPRQTRPFWKAKVVAIGLTMGTITLLVLASGLVLVSGLIINGVANESGIFAPELLRIWQLLSWPLALGMVAIAAAFVYRYGSSHWRSGTPILPGAVLAALIWAGVSALFRLYVSHFGNYNQLYGAVGAVIILLLWLYLSSLALLLGAQLNMTVGESMRRSRSQLRRTPTLPTSRSSADEF